MNLKQVFYRVLNEHIRTAAYYKWQAAGQPSGRDQEFWLEAEREYQRTFIGRGVPAAGVRDANGNLVPYEVMRNAWRDLKVKSFPALYEGRRIGSTIPGSRFPDIGIAFDRLDIGLGQYFRCNPYELLLGFENKDGVWWLSGVHVVPMTGGRAISHTADYVLGVAADRRDPPGDLRFHITRRRVPGDPKVAYKIKHLSVQPRPPGEKEPGIIYDQLSAADELPVHLSPENQSDA